VHCGSWIVLAGVLLTGPACAHRGGAAEDTSAAPRDDEPVVLNVINRFGIAVDIHAIGSGTSYRMGTVHPGMSARFVLRPSMVGVGPVEFLAQPINNDPPARSGRLLLRRGAIVDFEIATHLHGSTATVRP
jgi:hypothetical protein